MHASEKAVILIIDNDPLTLTGMAAVLNQAGYTCHVARDSEAALRGAASICPDLILCDVEIEGDAGLEICDDLHALAGMDDVPVVYIAATRRPDIVDRVHAAGGAYYLSKPLDPWVLLEVVDKALWMPHLVSSHMQNQAAAQHERHDTAKAIPGPTARPAVQGVTGRPR